jgi:hypothetical protein
MNLRCTVKVDDDWRCLPAVNGEVVAPCTAVHKFLSRQGLFHALPTMVPPLAALLGIEYRPRRRLRYSVIAVAVLASHRLLDIVDGRIVPLPFPFVEAGTELVYPATVTVGQGPVGVVDGSGAVGGGAVGGDANAEDADGDGGEER